MEQQTQEIAQVMQINEQSQVDSVCSYKSEEHNSAFAAYKEKENEFKQYKANIQRNKEIKNILESEITDLKKQQSDMINKGAGTAKELTAINKEIASKQDLIDMYDTAFANENDSTEIFQAELCVLSATAKKAATDIIKGYRESVEGELLQPGIEQLRKVLTAQVKDTSCHPYLHGQISDRPVSEILAEKLGQMILSAYKNSENDDHADTLKQDLSDYQNLDFDIVDKDMVGSPFKLLAIKSKHNL